MLMSPQTVEWVKAIVFIGTIIAWFTALICWIYCVRCVWLYQKDMKRLKRRQDEKRKGQDEEHLSDS